MSVSFSHESMNPCLCFVVLQEFGALQMSLLKHNRRLKQRALCRTLNQIRLNYIGNIDSTVVEMWSMRIIGLTVIIVSGKCMGVLPYWAKYIECSVIGSLLLG